MLSSPGWRVARTCGARGAVWLKSWSARARRVGGWGSSARAGGVGAAAHLLAVVHSDLRLAQRIRAEQPLPRIVIYRPAARHAKVETEDGLIGQLHSKLHRGLLARTAARRGGRGASWRVRRPDDLYFLDGRPPRIVVQRPAGLPANSWIASEASGGANRRDAARRCGPSTPLGWQARAGPARCCRAACTSGAGARARPLAARPLLHARRQRPCHR
eukprot:scaffold1747_cov108-Isochrysis_galbana.AAC.10